MYLSAPSKGDCSNWENDPRRFAHAIARTVYLEAEWDPRDPSSEMDFIAELRRQTGFPSVAIAHH